MQYESFGQIFHPAVTSRTLMAVCHAALGEFAEGITRRDEAIQIARAVNHPMALTYAYGQASGLYLIKGDIQQAIPCLEHAVSVCQSSNIEFLYTRIAVDLGYAYAQAQRGAEALPLLQVRGYVLHPERLIEPYLFVGRLEEAYARAIRALEESRLERLQGTQAQILCLLGDIAIHRNPPDIDESETYYRQALALADELGMRPLQAHCHRGLGTLYGQIGQSEQARAELSTAIDMYRDMEMTFWLPETEAALAAVEER